MYVSNLSELKKALRAKQESILVKDEKFKAKIIKTAMKKGRLYNYDGQKIVNKENLMSLPVAGVLAESTIIILSILTLFGILGLYALYKEFNIKVKINKDGNLSFETNKKN